MLQRHPLPSASQRIISERRNSLEMRPGQCSLWPLSGLCAWVERVQKAQAAATSVAAASSECALPLRVPRLAWTATRRFRASPSGLVYGRNGSPLLGPALRCAGRSWGLCSPSRCVLVQCTCAMGRDTAPTDIGTKVLVLSFVSCFGQPLAAGTNCLGL